MKLLFTVALMCVPFFVNAAEAEKPAPAAAPAAEEAPATRKATPGFWERAWQSTKKGTKRVVDGTRSLGSKTVDVVKSPFSGRKKNGAAASKSLLLNMTLEPAQVKLSAARSVKVAVTVLNQGRHAVQLHFPTTQRIEVLVKNDAGKVLSKWSDDQKVDKEQGFIVINPDERLEYSATISTRAMEAGRNYVIEAYLPEFESLRTSRPVSPVN